MRPANFIGMHFFSPADKMPLVEIICGEQTGDEALAAAFDLAQQLGKTPIVVNDAPGFFTTRVIGKTVSQGAQMVLEGIDPVLVEAAARANGRPVGPLAAIDEISQETAYRNGLQMKADAEARGETWQEQPAGELVRRMVEEFGRKGGAAAAAITSTRKAARSTSGQASSSTCPKWVQKSAVRGHQGPACFRAVHQVLQCRKA